MTTTVTTDHSVGDTVWRVSTDVMEAKVLSIEINVPSLTSLTATYTIQYTHSGLQDIVDETTLYSDVTSALAAYQTIITAP